MASSLAALRRCANDPARLRLLCSLKKFPTVDRVAETFTDDLYILQAIQYCAAATKRRADSAELSAAALGRIREDVYRLRAIEALLAAKVDLALAAGRIAGTFTDGFYANKADRLLNPPDRSTGLDSRLGVPGALNPAAKSVKEHARSAGDHGRSAEEGGQTDGLRGREGSAACAPNLLPGSADATTLPSGCATAGEISLTQAALELPSDSDPQCCSVTAGASAGGSES